MKRALHFATKLNSRDIQKCNCRWVPMICLPLLAKHYFPRKWRPVFTDWETRGRLCFLIWSTIMATTRPIGKFTPSPSTVRPLFPARPFPCISPLSPFWIAKHCSCVIYPSVFLLPFLLEPISLDNQLLHTAHLHSVSSSTKFVEHFVRIYCKTHSFLTYKLYLKLLLISSHMARIFLLTLYYSKFCESQYQWLYFIKLTKRRLW